MNYSLSATIIVLPLIFILEGIFPHFPSRNRRLRHALFNISLGIIAGGMIRILSLLAPFYSGALSSLNHIGVLHQSSLSPGTELVAVFLTFDLWMYLWHRMNHRIHFLWRFHRAHHIDPEMDTTTAIRFHPGELILSYAANFIVIVLLGIDLSLLAFYLAAFQINILFHHSNIGIPEKYDRVLRAIIVTPNMHRVHHSIIQSETDSNYSSLFSVWDRLARTFRRRADTLRITLGMPGVRQKPFSFKEILTVPVRNLGVFDHKDRPR